MAHAIKLKYGSAASWSYIDLTDVNHGNVDYYPGTPGEGVEDITESGRWRIAGSSVADLIAKITEIEQVFYKAGVYSQDHIGAYQVYLTMQLDSVADTWESEIFEGRLELTEDILSVDWANKTTEAVLIWRRAPWWEKYTAVAATNSNISGSDYIVYNSGDASGTVPAKYENWLNIAAGAVPGDLPAPAVLRITLKATLNNFVVVNNAKVDNALLVLRESAAGGTVDAARSGGRYHTVTTPVGGTTGVDYEGDTQPLTNIFNGGWFRFLLSANFTGTVYARPYIKWGSKVYYGPKSAIIGTGAFKVYDLGLMPIITASLGPISADLYFTAGINFIAATAIAVAVDYFYNLPTDYYANGVVEGGVADHVVILDSRRSAALTYAYTAPSTYRLVYPGTLYGNLYLEPNMAQKLYFKLTASGVDTMANYAIIAVYAWLRKRTL